MGSADPGRAGESGVGVELLNLGGYAEMKASRNFGVILVMKVV